MPIFYPQINVQIGSNTAGTTANIQTGTMTLAGGSNITLSQNANGITFHGAAGGTQSNQSLGFYGSSNTTGGSSSSTFDARSVTFVGQGAVSVGATNGSWIISSPNTVAQSNVTLSQWPPSYVVDHNQVATPNAATGATGGSVQTTATYRIGMYQIEQNISFNRIMGECSLSQGATAQGSATIGVGYGLYTLNGGTRFDSVSTWCMSAHISQSNAGGTAHTHRIWWGTNSNANSTQYNGNVSASFYGQHQHLISEGAGSISKGVYFLVLWNFTKTNTANIVSIASNPGYSRPTATNLAGVTNLASYGIGYGIFSSTSNNTFSFDPCMPATINTNVITCTASAHNFQPIIWFKMS